MVPEPYQFLAITDHNRFSEAQRFVSQDDDRFRILGGEEITMRAPTSQVHVNAICTKRRIGGGTFPSASEALVWLLDQIDQQNGIAIVNHPNFDRGLRTEDLLAARSAPLLEIMSGHPYVYSEGKTGPPVERGALGSGPERRRHVHGRRGG